MMSCSSSFGTPSDGRRYRTTTGYPPTLALPPFIHQSAVASAAAAHQQQQQHSDFHSYYSPRHLSPYPLSAFPNGRSSNMPSDGHHDGGEAPPRKRIAMACNRCRKRKIRCSGDPGGGQPCVNCKSAGAETCQFLRVSSTHMPMRDNAGEGSSNSNGAPHPHSHGGHGSQGSHGSHSQTPAGPATEVGYNLDASRATAVHRGSMPPLPAPSAYGTTAIDGLPSGSSGSDILAAAASYARAPTAATATAYSAYGTTMGVQPQRTASSASVYGWGVPGNAYTTAAVADDDYRDPSAALQGSHYYPGVMTAADPGSYGGSSSGWGTTASSSRTSSRAVAVAAAGTPGSSSSMYVSVDPDTTTNTHQHHHYQPLPPVAAPMHHHVGSAAASLVHRPALASVSAGAGGETRHHHHHQQQASPLTYHPAAHHGVHVVHSGLPAVSMPTPAAAADAAAAAAALAALPGGPPPVDRMLPQPLPLSSPSRSAGLVRLITTDGLPNLNTSFVGEPTVLDPSTPTAHHSATAASSPIAFIAGANYSGFGAMTAAAGGPVRVKAESPLSPSAGRGGCGSISISHDGTTGGGSCSGTVDDIPSGTTATITTGGITGGITGTCTTPPSPSDNYSSTTSANNNGLLFPSSLRDALSSQGPAANVDLSAYNYSSGGGGDHHSDASSAYGGATPSTRRTSSTASHSYVPLPTPPSAGHPGSGQHYHGLGAYAYSTHHQGHSHHHGHGHHQSHHGGGHYHGHHQQTHHHSSSSSYGGHSQHHHQSQSSSSAAAAEHVAVGSGGVGGSGSSGSVTGADGHLRGSGGSRR